PKFGGEIMCPEIYIDKKLIVDVPDKTGYYQTPDGKPLYINVDGIGAENTSQTIIVEAAELAGRPGARSEHGRRELQLSLVGTGAQKLRSPDPYRKEIGPMMEIVLKNRPIGRISRKKYKEKLEGLNLEGATKNYIQPHPRWQQGRGRR
ncbi:MAG TPA: hypothetical protein VNA13_04835, partial [Xanthomonadales bacterium]|nr:hypothetical protein [Xanthomonadales bacterium]